MERIRLTIEAKIDEKELAEIENSKNDYNPLSIKEYFDGMKFSYEEGRLILLNEVEEHFNAYEGDSECIRYPKLIKKEIKRCKFVTVNPVVFYYHKNKILMMERRRRNVGIERLSTKL